MEQIKACESSGLSRAEYCRQNHISLSSLSNWYSKLKKEDGTSTGQNTSGFIRVLPDKPELPAQGTQTASITAHDVTVRLENIVDPNQLIPWITALRRSL